MKLKEFEANLLVFLDQLFLELDSVGLDLSNNEMDHVCWRCETKDEYAGMTDFLDTQAKLFHTSIHNGREISLYHLHSEIEYKGRKISLIELPFPKENKPYNSGFEHAEFIVEQALETWHQQYPMNWDRSGLKKVINPTLKLSFGNICIKIHPYSLAYVVKHLE